MSDGIELTTETVVEYCKAIGDPQTQLKQYQQAVVQFPTLTPLWKGYIDTARSCDVGNEKLEAVYQQSLANCSVPDISIWTEYLTFLVHQSSDISWIRLKFNEALVSLPLQEHRSIWREFLRFADMAGGRTGALVLLRYLEYATQDELSGRSLDPELWTTDQVILKYAEFGAGKQALETFEKLQHNLGSLGLHLERNMIQIWSEMMDLLLSKTVVSKDTISHEKVEQIAFSITSQFPDQEATVYLKLALFYMSLQNTAKVRHLFNSGIKACNTVKDFVILYDTYVEFEEKLLTKMSGDLEIRDEDEDENEQEWSEFDFRMDKLDRLIESRAILMNDVQLRVDPHNLDHWFDRLAVVKTDMNKTLETYVRAISSVNPLKYTSNNSHTLPELWINYSKVYSSNSDTKTADLIFSKAVESQYRNTDELAEIYIAWCDLLLETDNEKKAILLLQEQLKPLSQAKIAANTKIWQYYIDLLESGVDDESQVDTVADAYEQMIERKVATVVNVLSYAAFLIDWKLYERALGVYEQGLRLFKLEPTIKFEIWNVYLAKLIAFKLSPERIRDLFDQCTEDLPGKYLKGVIILESDFEANTMHSLLYSIKALQKGVKLVSDPGTIAELYRLLIGRLTQLNDVSEYRRNMEQIVNNKHLSLADVVEFAQKFIDFEVTHQEYKRARQLYVFVTELASPKLLQDTWTKWEKFEVDHGTVETYKAMLKSKRKVTKTFDDKPTANPMGFIKSDQIKGGAISIGQQQHQQNNPDAIDMDMDMDMDME